MKDLIHKFNNTNASNFEDVSIELNNYIVDNVKLKINSENQYFIGLYKPFTNLYLDFVKPSSRGSDLSFKYYNGTSFVNVPVVKDETKSFSRSGFVKFNFGQPKILDLWKESTIDGVTAYWIEITGQEFASDFISSSLTTNTINTLNMSDTDIAKYSVGQEVYCIDTDTYHVVSAVDSTVGAAFITVTPDALVAFPDNSVLYDQIDVNGVNMVFANDSDLVERYRGINNFLGGDANYISYHQASRKDIIQDLRNSGKTKVGQDSCEMEDLEIWDFLKPEQLRNAAAYLCLSKIFGGVSDNSEGKFFQLSKIFYKQYQKAVDTYLLNYDVNDNGQQDRSESSSALNIGRVVML